MAQFVNYKKRGCTLPPGCKDLIDVLKLSRRRTKGHILTGGFQPLKIREQEFPTAGLAQIGRYVSMLLKFRGELFTLSIRALDFEFPVTLYRYRSEQTVSIVLVTKSARRQQAIRAFFGQQGLQVVLALRDTPDAACGLTYPLPVDLARVTSLATELLRSVYGLSDEAGLSFCCYEMEKTA